MKHGQILQPGFIFLSIFSLSEAVVVDVSGFDNFMELFVSDMGLQSDLLDLSSHGCWCPVSYAGIS